MHSFSASIRTRFMSVMESRLIHMRQLRKDMVQSGSQGAVQEFGQIAHKIAGTAATIGFPDLGAEASQIDDMILRAPAQEDALDHGLKTRIDKLIAMMSDIVETSQQDPVEEIN